jgi:hypothetical protein
MPFIYECSKCGVRVERHHLTVKRVGFRGMGEHGATKKSRVVGWLCDTCLTDDPEWNAPPGKNYERMKNQEEVKPIVPPGA